MLPSVFAHHVSGSRLLLIADFNLGALYELKLLHSLFSIRLSMLPALMYWFVREFMTFIFKNG